MSAEPPPSASTSAVPPTTHEIRGWRRVVLFPFGILLRLWAASLRFELSRDSLRNVTVAEPAALVVWHNRLFISSEIFRRYRTKRRLYCLVSASKDGAWLTAFFSLAGMHTVRGSSSRLGREALTALINVLKAGHDIGITPDGPRGPMYDFKAGGLIAARRAHVPLLLLGVSFESARQLRSWDRFYLPAPFSRVRLVCDYVPTTELADRDAAADHLRARMLAISPDNIPDGCAGVV